MRAFVLEQARAAGLGEEELEDLVQAVDELATNALVHGYRRRPGPISVDVEPRADGFVVRIRDEAPSFDPRAWPEPDHLARPLEARRPGGFGIHLARGCVDEIHHRERNDGRPGGNELTLIKRGGGREQE